MKVWDSVKNKLVNKWGSEADIKSIAQKRGLFVGPVSNYIPSHIGTEAAGENVNHSNALTFTGAFAAISINAENIASLPKMVYKETATGKTEDKKHPVYNLIHFQPNPIMTDFVFWEKMSADVDGWGNAYALIETNALGYPVALWPIDPDNVQIIYNEKQLYYKVLTGDFTGTYTAAEMLHFKLFTKDGIIGIDPITYHAQSIGIGIAGQKFAAETFSSKGALRGVLEMDGELDETQYQKLTERFNNSKNHSTQLLEYNIKYKPITFSPDAIQAIQARLFSIQDASRIWKVPLSLLAELTHGTFSNTEQQDIQYTKYGLRPRCKRFETELETKLFPAGSRGQSGVKFDLKGLLRGDLKTQAEFYHKAILDGWMNRNEVRQLENRNPVEGLDEYLVPTNMTLPEALEQAIENSKTQE